MSLLVLMAMLWMAPGESDTVVTPVDNPVPVRADLFRYTAPTLPSVYEDDWDAEKFHYRSERGFDYWANSDGITARLPTRKQRGKPIPEWMKWIDRNRMDDRFKFEDKLAAGASHRFYVPKYHTAFILGYRVRSLNVLNAGKSAYDFFYAPDTLAFRKEQPIGELLYENLVYNEFKAGFMKKAVSGKVTFTYGAAIAFLQGVNMQLLDLTGAKWGMNPDSSWYLSYNLEYHRAKATQPRQFETNGKGGSADFFLGVNIKNKWKLAFSITDIGGFSFNEEPVTYIREDSVIRGPELLDILKNMGNTNLAPASIDNLMNNLGIGVNTDRVRVFLPFTASFSASGSFFKDRLVLTAGVLTRNLPGYYAYGYLKTNVMLPRNWVVSNNLGYGGYSRFNWGVELGKTWKHVDFILGSANLVGLVSPKYYYGRSLYLRIGTQF